MRGQKLIKKTNLPILTRLANDALLLSIVCDIGNCLTFVDIFQCLWWWSLCYVYKQ